MRSTPQRTRGGAEATGFEGEAAGEKIVVNGLGDAVVSEAGHVDRGEFGEIGREDLGGGAGAEGGVGEGDGEDGAEGESKHDLKGPMRV